MSIDSSHYAGGMNNNAVTETMSIRRLSVGKMGLFFAVSNLLSSLAVTIPIVLIAFFVGMDFIINSIETFSPASEDSQQAEALNSLKNISGIGGLIMIFAISTIVYSIIAFIIGAFMAIGYNIIAKLTGGIEVTLEDS